ncbi:glycoside hydrolase family 3 N-terminal domain-containing protein [Microbacterium sp. GXF6406]
MAKIAVRAAAALVIALGLIGMPAASAAPVPAMVQRAEKTAPAQHATRLVEAMTTEERAASIVMGHIPSTDPAVLAQYMADTGIGGFILMGANIPDDEGRLQQITAALSTDPAVPALIAIDQEGGLVSRLPWDDFAASTTLKNAPVDQTQVAFAGRAALVARAGATVNFGVVADTTADTGSFIYGRALGADPDTAAARVAAAVAAEDPLAASTLKHFPGHGATPGDSHELIPSTSKSRAQWEKMDAVPFVAGIEAGASLLMFGHLAYTAVDELPASMSATWHDIARDDLGFDGVIVTDDLGMLQSSGIAAYADPVANAVAAVAAGNDLVLTIAHSTPQTVVDITQGIVAAVESGTIDEARLQDAAERVMTLRLERAASAAVWSPAD